MCDEEIGIRRLEHYDLHRWIRLELGHERSQFDDRCGDKHVDRRVAECDRPPARIASVDFELRRLIHGASPCEDPYRSDLKPARTSSANSCGCSQAAKWPPLGSWL